MSNFSTVRQYRAWEIAEKYIKQKLSEEDIDKAIEKLYPHFVLSDGYVGDMRKAVRDWVIYYQTGNMPK